MEFDSFDDGDDGEYDSVNSVEISIRRSILFCWVCKPTNDADTSQLILFSTKLAYYYMLFICDVTTQNIFKSTSFGKY